MRLKVILEKFHAVLDVNYGKDEVNSFFDLLVEHYLDMKRIQLVINPEFEISEPQVEMFLNALEDLNSNKPIQYIIGQTEFYGLPFKVTKDTLIPRPETEELVDWIITSNSDTTEQAPFNILDIGTGSGCISTSLAKNLLKANVYALDVSKDALNVAKQNAKLNDVEVEFMLDDILNTDGSASHNYNLIVSNPPYVRNLEKTEIKPNVLNNEPHLALFVNDENPLQFYKAICVFAQQNLNNNGVLYFEINEYLGKEMIQLLKDFGFKSIELKKDMFGKDRMIRGTK